MFESISPIFRDSLIKMANDVAENRIVPINKTAQPEQVQPEVKVEDGRGWAVSFVKQAILTKLASEKPHDFGKRTGEILNELRDAIDEINGAQAKKEASVKVVTKGF